MFDTQKNEKGFTLIEMLISMVIGIALLGTAIYSYTKQDSLLRDENSNVQLRNFARLAVDELVPEIRMAGFGFPPGDSTLTTPRPARAIVVADATTFTYMANTDDISINSNADGIATTDNWVSCDDPAAAGFAAGDNAVFFNANDPIEWNSYTVDGVFAASIDWDVGEANGFLIETATKGIPVVVSNYHMITIFYDAGTQLITVTDDNGTFAGGDDTTITVANNVSELTFSYFDANGNPLAALPLSAADLGDIRRVQIFVTVVNADDNNLTATLRTNIHLRNMGI
jgi:prepilin-type N-terminal cleavage/methylation domain-containing protein